MTMTVVDDSLYFENNDSASGLSVVIFKPDPSGFPDVRSEDEIVQFRHMKIQTFQGSLQALCAKWTAFTVFSRNERGQWVTRPERPVEPGEVMVLDRIAARTGHVAAVVRASPKKPQGRQTLTIDLLRPDVYFDLIAEVVAVLSPKPSQQTILLCDYTANAGIRVSPADFSLPADYEHRLMLTTFWDNFANKAGQLEEGQIIRVVNLRTKIISGGDLGSGGLIAVLHGDRSNAEKIFVVNPTSREAQVILERKKAIFEPETELKALNSPIKRSPVKNQPQITPRAPVSPSRFRPLTSILHNDVSVCAIKSVLDSDQVPAKFVIKGRVTDYKPTGVPEFVRRFCTKCLHSAPLRSPNKCLSCHEMMEEFVFMFTIEITDGVDKITVIVAYQDAIRFLNGLVPCNTGLSQNQATLEYLEECMQRLITSPIPTPFCIKSYRVAEERRYRLFDTLLTIQ